MWRPLKKLRMRGWMSADLEGLVPGESAGNLLWAWKSSPSQNPRRTAVEAPNVAAGWVQSPRAGHPLIGGSR